MKRLCVFCGSSSGTDPRFAASARELGAELARRQIELVYGAGNVGLMGILADATLASGGHVIGVIPDALVQKELAHRGLTALHIVGSMHERKAMMADFAEGFLAIPGGYGTLDEFCEILTWVQLGFHRKPCGLLNVLGYYDAFLQQVEHSVKTGFLRAEHRDMLIVDTDISRLIDRMNAAHPTVVQKWLDRDQL